MIHNIKEIIRLYHKYHPEFSYSMISFVVLFMLIATLSFGNRSSNSDYIDLKKFNMIELKIHKKKRVQDIKISERFEENDQQIVEEKKDLQFGNANEFNNLINSGTPPRPKFYSLPEYPNFMRKAGVEGIVIIELGIDVLGDIKYGKIVKSLGREFDVVVINWAKQISFTPALDPDNCPMKCKIQMPVRFKLDM